MYLHLGQDVVVRLADVVGIFDLENTTLEKNSRIFLNKASKEHRVVNVSEEMPKSFVVCVYDEDGEKKEVVYISQISPQTLKKRARFLNKSELGNLL